MTEMTEPAAVVLVGSDPDLLKEVAGEVHGAPLLSCASLRELDAKLVDGAPVIVMLGPEYARLDRLICVSAVVCTRPEVVPVLLTPRLSAKVMQVALRAGIRDVVELPVKRGELHRALDRLSRSCQPIDGGRQVGPAAAPPGRLITLFSAKGGVGKSVMATNLGASLAQRAPGGAVLVDLDLQFGDAAVMLGVEPMHTIAELTGRQLDRDLVDELLLEHASSKLRLLAAPVEPALADEIVVADVISAVDVLRAMFSFVVVDTPAQMSDLVLSVVEKSDDLVMVSGLDVPSVKNTKIALETMRLVGLGRDDVVLVINRVHKKSGVEVAEAEKVLKTKAAAVVPEDPAVPSSVNRGVPVVVDAPRTPAARGIQQVADLLKEQAGRAVGAR